MINLRLLGRYLDPWLRTLDPKWLPLLKARMYSIPVDELIGSLQSYVLDLSKTNKSKSMAFKSVDDVDGNRFDDKLFTTKIANLVKNFRNFLRNNNRRAWGKNDAKPRNFTRNEPTKVNNTNKPKEKVGQTSNISMGQQFFGCQGYGYVKSWNQNVLHSWY